MGNPPLGLYANPKTATFQFRVRQNKSGLPKPRPAAANDPNAARPSPEPTATAANPATCGYGGGCSAHVQLQPHDVAETPLQNLGRDGIEQVADVFDLVVGVARYAEGVPTGDFPTGEEFQKVSGDDLSHRHEYVSICRGIP